MSDKKEINVSETITGNGQITIGSVILNVSYNRPNDSMPNQIRVYGNRDGKTFSLTYNTKEGNYELNTKSDESDNSLLVEFLPSLVSKIKELLNTLKVS